MARRVSWRIFVMVVLLALGVGLGLASRAGNVASSEYEWVASANREAGTAASSWDLVIQRVTFEPGTTSGWHSHPGGVFVAVVSGVLTVYSGDDVGYTAQIFTAGQGFFEPANKVLLVRNATARSVWDVRGGPGRRSRAGHA